jgi:REP element-mobilizing transposase RayT
MARLPRSALPPEGIYHVTSRGVARCAIFGDDEDRRELLRLLWRVARRWAWRCPAFTLMTNHFHLLVDTELEALSAGMSALNGLYAQEFNEKYTRVGHLFQGRFEARVLRDEEHLENACAYVWNNPVRVGLCETAADWPWNGSI